MLTQICSWGNALRLVGLILFLSAAGPALAKTAATNTLTISESLIEKVACTKNPATLVWNCGIVAGDNYTIAATVLLSGVPLTAFTGDTTFDLRVGNLHISHPLSFDPKYTTGKTSATFVSSYTGSNNKKVVYQTVVLKWTTSQLTISINGKTADTTSPGWTSIRADTYAGDDSRAITDATTGSISFGATGVNFNPTPVTGSVVTKSVKGKDNTTYKVSTVKINKGTVKGVVAVPVVPGVHVTLGAITSTTNLTVGSQGGTIGFSVGPLNGVTVSVPVGALPSNMPFTVSHNAATLDTNMAGSFSGHVIDLHVAGTPTNGINTFDQPIGITIPFTNDGTSVPVPYYIDATGSLHPAQVVSIDNQSGHLTFETFHASPYTWILASLTNLLGNLTLHNATTYFPWVDGFQVGNPGSIYNPGGECFGITAFAQWYFREKAGGLYSKYMQNIPLGSGGATIKGQEVIRTRAFDSVSRLFDSYVPRRSASFNLTPAQRYASICNILVNTKVPTILSTFGHSILVYDFYSSGATQGVLLVNDPNYPGEVQQIRYDPAFSNRFQYVSPDMTWSNLAVMGDGSFQMEGFDTIYADAEAGFNGNGAAQVAPTSHTNGQAVTQRNITLTGIITNGQVVVDNRVGGGGQKEVDPLFTQENGALHAQLAADFEVRHRAFGTGEVNQDLAVRQGFADIGLNHHAAGLAQESGGVIANGMTRGHIGGTGEHTVVRLTNRLNQHMPHAATGTSHGNFYRFRVLRHVKVLSAKNQCEGDSSGGYDLGLGASVKVLVLDAAFVLLGYCANSLAN